VRAVNSKLILVACVMASTFGVGQASAATRLETEVAAAVGRAAGRVANTAVSRVVLKDTARLRGPACRAGARDLGLRGIKHAIFVAECAKVL
jgi:hypothetical protein